jgi:hypothetical protein
MEQMVSRVKDRTVESAAALVRDTFLAVPPGDRSDALVLLGDTVAPPTPPAVPTSRAVPTAPAVPTPPAVPTHSAAAAQAAHPPEGPAPAALADPSAPLAPASSATSGLRV